MNSKNFGKAIVMMVVIAALILLAINSNATAQEGGEDRTGHEETEQTQEDRGGGDPVPGGPGFVAVHPMGLQMVYSNSTWAYQGFELYNTSTSPLNAATTVFLPNGAVITQIVFYFYDNSDAGFLSAWLTRQPLGGGPYIDMATIYTSGNPGYGILTDTNIQEPVIDNAKFAYFVDTLIVGGYSTNLRVTGIRIDYEYPTYLPTILN